MGYRDLPFLPPSPYTWEAKYGEARRIKAGIRLSIAALGLPTSEPDPPTEQELRWRAEDEWLTRQWQLLDG